MKMKYLIPLFLSRVLVPIYKMGKPIFSMIKYLDKLPLSKKPKLLGKCEFNHLIINLKLTKKENAVKTDLKVMCEFFIQCLEEIFSISFSISLSDQLSLSSISMTQDGDNQLLICSPSYNDIDHSQFI